LIKDYFEDQRRHPFTVRPAKPDVSSKKKPLHNAARHEEAKKEEQQLRARRFRPGTVALREIKKYQRMTRLFLPRTSFQRLVRDIMEPLNPSLRVQP
jgi:histone H3